jgi:hypothetical protein
LRAPHFVDASGVRLLTPCQAELDALLYRSIFPRVSTRDIQQIIDQSPEMLCLAFDHFDRALRNRIFHLARQRLTFDRIECWCRGLAIGKPGLA